MGKIIGLTYDLKSDLKPKENDPLDFNAEFDTMATINLIKSAILAGGHEVELIGNFENLLKRLPDLGVDIVFNICEGVGLRNREAQVPVVLERYGIPYVGSDGLTMSLSLDKVMTKKILEKESIPTPRYVTINKVIDTINLDHLRFPLITKLRWEGTSKGLTDKSVVHNVDELNEQVKYLFNTYKNCAVLIEELIIGSEFTVPLIGNEPVEALAPAQVLIRNQYDVGEMIYTFQMATDPEVIDYVCPAPISQQLDRKLRNIAIDTYKAVDCKDFGRVDIRVDREGNPYVLEINPLPSLAADDVFAISPKTEGLDYNSVINRIIHQALKRHQLV